MKTNTLDFSKLNLSFRKFIAPSLAHVLYATIDAGGETRVLGHEQLSPTVGPPVPGARVFVGDRLYDVIGTVRCPDFGILVAEVVPLESAHDLMAARARERQRSL